MSFLVTPSTARSSVLAVVLLSGALTSAQSTNHLPAATATNSPSSDLIPPVPKSPVEFFRELLAKSREEQQKWLADRPPEARKQLLAKIREYKVLKPDQRDLRLKATELRWYLWPLLNAPATNRAPLMVVIPEKDRKLVEDRLREWDLLPEKVQKELLETEAVARYVSSTAEQRTNFLQNISPERRQWLEAGILRLQALPEEQRQAILARFNRFFDFRPEERDRILSTLSDAERQEIDKTLKKFAELPRSQRVQALRSFEKFTELTVEERQQFLKNAERWKLMTPAERQSWKDLVSNLSLQPPAPTIPTPSPPRPPPAHFRSNSAGVASSTNN